MDYINNFLSNYTNEIIFTAAVLSLASFILMLINYWRTKKILRKYKRLMRGADNKNLEAMLYNHLDSLQQGMTRIKDLELKHTSLSGELNRCIQRIGIVRYNAFDQIGGEQSYSIAMLDKAGDGIVLTGLYGRSSSTTFAKPVHDKKSKYPLSSEEEEAIEKAFRLDI